jgi:hypothetical protein
MAGEFNQFREHKLKEVIFRPLFLFKNDHNFPLPVVDTFVNIFCADYSTRVIRAELRILIGKVMWEVRR